MAFLIDDILLLPVDGVVWLGKKIRGAGLAELYDESKVHEALMALAMRLELGEMTNDEYLSEESMLLRRLDEIKKHKEEEGT